MGKKLDAEKVHKWRLCPYAEHWVSEHVKTVNGKKFIWHGHCAVNPSGKDQLYPNEILEIQKKYFNRIKLTISLAPNTKKWKFKNDPNKYDSLINGWTRYWNEVFNLKDPLDPDLVKALMASESGFNENAINNNGPRSKARGLLQLIDETIKAIGDEEGELKDHFVNITHDEALDPSLNICAGIRWLFRKKETASNRLKRSANWNEAMMEYKAILAKKLNKKPYNKKILSNFNQYFKELKGKK